MILEEISSKKTESRPFKVLNKKVLSGKNVQLNLMNGRNIITKEKVKTGDTVILNFKDNKITKVIQMKKGETVFVMKGGHMGHHGKIEEISHRGGKDIVKMTSGHKKINVWIKNLIAVGDN